MFNRNKRKLEIKNRLIGLLSLFLLVLIVLSTRVYYVQNKYSTRDTGAFKGNHKQNEKISDDNYSLLDKNGEPLFEYETKYKVVIDSMAFQLNNLNQNMENIIAFNYIMKGENEEFSFDSVVRSKGKLYYDISEESFNKINSLKYIKGVYTYLAKEKKEDESWKIENIITSKTGFIQVKSSGVSGKVETKEVEKSQESLEILIDTQLKGNEEPKVIFERNHDGLYGEGKYVIPESNLNVKLTLDKDIQDMMREVLNREEYKRFSNAGAILIDSKSGEILGLAQKNEAMPNVVLGSGNINGYEAGSIFKILTLEAAMELKDIKLDDKLTCEGIVCKEDKVHGNISIREAFEVSCNDVFSKLGAEIGAENLIEFAKKQGVFSSVLELDMLTGMETLGFIPDNVSITNLAIGQSMQTNLIQMAGAVSSIVNDGLYVKPTILQGLEDQNGIMKKKLLGVEKEVISKKTANEIKNVMNSTVEKGTAMVTQIDGVEIGAKTGTAETNEDQLHGWFLGYFNHKGKYYTLGVMVPNIKDVYDEKKPGGGNTAGPIFRDIVLEFIKK